MFETHTTGKQWLRASSAGVSLLVHAAAILLALLIGGPVAQLVVQPRAVALITAPPTLKHSIKMPPRPLHLVQPPSPPHAIAFKRPVTPVLRAPAIELPPAPVVEPTRVREPAPELPQIQTKLASPVKTGEFAAALPVNPARPLQPPVRASAFDAQPNTQAATPRGPVTTSSGFDGVGVTEEHRKPTRVSQSGFSEQSPLTAPQSAGRVKTSSGFADATSKPPVLSSLPQTRTAPSTTPAEILSKPRPVYTEEARALSIEGEVLVEVVLEASGTVRVVRLVKGLGHGLDENAKAAAGEIRFRPSLREGVPADSTAVVHILFQLAN